MNLVSKWYSTLFTYVWVFNTGRGLSIFMRLPHNVGIVYDLGASDDFSPSIFIGEKIVPYLTRYSGCPIGQCFLSHPHSDHISEIDAISGDRDTSRLYPYLITCPNDKVEGQEVDFDRLVNDDNRELIGKYRAVYSKRTPPLQTLQNCVPCGVPNVEYGFYYLVPSRVDFIHEASDQDYGNGLSLVFYLRHGNQTLLIPGDITPEVFDCVIDGKKDVERRYLIFGSSAQPNDWHSRTSTQPTLQELLDRQRLSVLVAPHHGLESCFSEKLFASLKGGMPMINVISEKRHLSDSDGKVDERYQLETAASGLDVDIDEKIERGRRSVSTRDGHHILLVFQGTNAAPRVYLRKTAKDLLNIA